MNDDEAWQAELAAVLRDQDEAATALRDALREEHAALEQSDAAENLAGIAATKEALLHRLGTAEERRRRWIAASGRDAATDAWLPDGQTDRHEITTLWQALVRHVSECQRLNAANGRVIHQRREFVDGALRVLRGQPAKPAVYTVAGRPASSPGGRRLGSV